MAIGNIFSQIDKVLLQKLGVFILLYITLIFFGIIPSIKQKAQLKETRQSSRDARKRALNSAQSVNSLSQDGLELDALFGDISDRVVTKREVKNMLGEISEMANSCDVVINEIVPDDYTGEKSALLNEFCEVQVFELKLEGGFHAVGSFLEKIENHYQIIRIIGLKLMPSTKDESLHRATMTIALFAKNIDLLQMVSLQ